MLIEMHVIFQGKVQGVGFRYTAKGLSEQFKVTGTVSNLKDGSVELIAQGEESALKQLSETLLAHFRGASITCSEFRAAKQPFEQFSIL